MSEIKSKRVQNFPAELAEIMIKKMKELAPKEFQIAVDQKDGNYLCGLAAQALTALKIREKTNKNDGVMVEMIQKVGGGKKGWAWCMYQVMTCIGMAEMLTGIVSPAPYTGSCAAFRKAAKGHVGVVPFDESQFGDIWIKVYTNGTGHTEIFEVWIDKPKTAHLNGGNTSGGSTKPGGKVVREGGGSYRTARDIKKDNWIMCYRPFPKNVSAPVVKDKKESTYPKMGEISDRVASLQKALTASGFKTTVDGSFGPKTKESVSKFQKSKKLAGSGIIGEKTMAYLGLTV